MPNEGYPKDPRNDHYENRSKERGVPMIYGNRPKEHHISTKDRTSPAGVKRPAESRSHSEPKRPAGEFKPDRLNFTWPPEETKTYPTIHFDAKLGIVPKIAEKFTETSDETPYRPTSRNHVQFSPRVERRYFDNDYANERNSHVKTPTTPQIVVVPPSAFVDKNFFSFNEKM